MIKRVGLDLGLGSKFAALIALLIITAAGMLMFLYDRAHVSKSLEQTESSFHRYTEAADSQLIRHISEVKRNLAMLSIAPPVRGIARSTANFGIDPTDGSTSRQWKARLADILIASAKANPSYVQMRYIGIGREDDFGHEYMRIDRKDGTLGMTPFSNLLGLDEKTALAGSLSLLQGEYSISNTSYQIESEQHLLSLATPIYAHDGILFGSLIIQFSLNRTLDLIKSQLPYGSEYILRSSTGEMIAASEGIYQQDLTSLTSLPVGDLTHFTFNKTDYVGMRKPIFFDERSGQRYWDMVVIAPKATATAYPISHQATLILIVLFSLVAIITSHYFIARITRPLILLSESAKRMARGNYRDVDIPHTDTRELNQLATAMRSAAADISSRERELDQLNAQLEAGINQRSIELDHQSRNLMTAQRIAQLGSWSWKLSGDLFSGSEQLFHILGIKHEQIDQGIEGFIKAFPQQEQPILRTEFDSLVSQKQNRIEVEVPLYPHGHALIEAEVVSREHGIPVHIEGIVLDISRRKIQQEQQRLLASVFSHSSEGIFITDPALRIIQVNPAFTKITGITAAEAVDCPADILCSASNDKSLIERIQHSLSHKDDWRGELEIVRYGVQSLNIWMTLNKVLDENSNISNYIGVLFDITEKKSADARISYLAFYDTLTGLANRRLFEERLQQSVRMCKRTQHSLALLYIDLDRFKSINDSLGHKTGDILLKQVAERLKTSVRESDTVARLGGDEFAIILEDSDEANVSSITESLLSRLAEPFSLDGHEAFAGASVGISIYPRDGDSADTLVRHADIAMYRAKDAGRNTYQFFSPDMNRGAQERLAYESALRHAIERNQLSLHYQAQADLKTGQVIGFEALLRWHHPTYGNISPDVFIPIAEDTGLIDKIGQWILKEACHQRIAWRNLIGDNVHIAVNISARQFRTNIVDQVRNTLKECQMPAKWLELEITESTLIQDAERAQKILGELSQLGIQLAIDDFGTGYSSLSYLKRFTVDKLKVDRSFIRDLPSDSDDIAITTAIIAMASHLGLRVIAEGTETQEQVNFLADHKCDEIQGYFFARPMPASGVEALIDEKSLQLKRIA
ncbi:MAG: EAL domain-containing protein [Pontibacterium sp.]